jgi:hypothetical protein
LSLLEVPAAFLLDHQRCRQDRLLSQAPAPPSSLPVHQLFFHLWSRVRILLWPPATLRVVCPRRPHRQIRVTCSRLLPRYRRAQRRILVFLLLGNHHRLRATVRRPFRVLSLLESLMGRSVNSLAVLHHVFYLTSPQLLRPPIQRIIAHILPSRAQSRQWLHR